MARFAPRRPPLAGVERVGQPSIARTFSSTWAGLVAPREDAATFGRDRANATASARRRVGLARQGAERLHGASAGLTSGSSSVPHPPRGARFAVLAVSTPPASTQYAMT